MPSHDQALVSVISQLALSFDGALLGVVLAYAAVRSLVKFAAHSSALDKIRNATSVSIPDLRSLLPPSDDPSQSLVEKNLVIVRGIVEAKSAVHGNWKSLGRSNVLVSQESGDNAVIVQRTQTCIYNEWKGFFGWTSDVRSVFGRTWRKQESNSLRMVPFVLVDGDQWPKSDYVSVNMDGSRQPIPLTTVYHKLQPIDAFPYTFLQAFFGHEYPVGLLDEEKILPLQKEITAVGICSFKNGIAEINSCQDVPYFLSDMTKDQMILDLAFETKVLMWSGVVLGSLAVGVLGFAIIRNMNKWKEWRKQRRSQQLGSTETSVADAADDESDVPEGQLCVICLMRKRRSVFIPCWHLACCNRCALSVEREASPICPICRQTIHTSQMIFVP